MSHIRAALAALLLVPAAAAAGEAPFTPGEELWYQVEALGMNAGKARLQVGPETSRDGAMTWPIVIEARTESLFDSVYSVNDKFVTFWEPDSGRVVAADFYEDENGKQQRFRARFDHDAGKAELRRVKKDGSRSAKDYGMPAGTFDIAGALMAIRTMELQPGMVIEVPVFSFRKVFTMRVHVTGIETVTTEAGSFRAYATRITMGFDGKLAQKRDVLAWFSADERKLPLKFDADLALGTLSVSLTRHRAGPSAVAAR